DLTHVVENLCIGAGLPVPSIHMIDSAAPNAFATGTNPNDASLVVTRGLLELLDRRELGGVIAHELSHIGNRDIALTTTLAAMIGTLSLPLRVLSAPLRIAFNTRQLGIALVVAGLYWIALFKEGSLLTMWWLVSGLLYLMPLDYLPETSVAGWWGAYAKALPVYGLLGAPLVALLVRQAVSRQREFLADGDAVLLTRDPEGLALALVKIDAAGNERLPAEESTVHLYFADPLAKSWFHIVCPTHPPIDERIERLARMGNGILPSAMQTARDAGARYTPSAVRKGDAASSSAQASDTSAFDGFTRVYDEPLEGSRLLALVPQDAVLKLEGRQGDFVRVTTEDGTPGYVFCRDAEGLPRG
ncbi:MAG TPA: M48 family metalloprotease, partial [Vicinamibacterales bacterium]|nr:M48 family metalloprotease [Vicinamibacterales bacterium]